MEDNDQEAALNVGADMRKIEYCFQLLKVRHQLQGGRGGAGRSLGPDRLCS